MEVEFVAAMGDDPLEDTDGEAVVGTVDIAAESAPGKAAEFLSVEPIRSLSD